MGSQPSTSSLSFTSQGQTLTFLHDKATGVVEQKISEVVAVGIHARLFAQARGPEEGKRLQCSKGRLTLGHCRGAAGYWKREEPRRRR